MGNLKKHIRNRNNKRVVELELNHCNKIYIYTVSCLRLHPWTASPCRALAIVSALYLPSVRLRSTA